MHRMTTELENKRQTWSDLIKGVIGRGRRTQVTGTGSNKALGRREEWWALFNNNGAISWRCWRKCLAQNPNKPMGCTSTVWLEKRKVCTWEVMGPNVSSGRRYPLPVEYIWQGMFEATRTAKEKDKRKNKVTPDCVPYPVMVEAAGDDKTPFLRHSRPSFSLEGDAIISLQDQDDDDLGSKLTITVILFQLQYVQDGSQGNFRDLIGHGTNMRLPSGIVGNLGYYIGPRLEPKKTSARRNREIFPAVFRFQVLGTDAWWRMR